MEDNIKTHLTSILDVYRQSIKAVTQYIEESEMSLKESETQITNAKEHKADVESKIAELESILGVEGIEVEEPAEAQVG